MEDALHSIFGYLDTDSLKQCRLVTSSWNPAATYFLMKRTYFELQAIPSDAEDYVNSAISLTSVKINEDLLSQLSQMEVPFSIQSSWKSIFVCVIHSASGIRKLDKFLTLISSGQCSLLSHLKIQFKEDPKKNQEIQSLDETLGEFKDLQLQEKLPEGENDARATVSNNANESHKDSPISPELTIQSLQLIFDNNSNTLQVSAFLQSFLKKEVVPHLKVLTAEFPGPKIQNVNPYFSKAYKTIMETFEESREVLRSLRVFKVKSNVPCGVSTCCSRFVEYFLYHKRIRDLPGPGLNLEFTGELRELQMGSGIVRRTNENGCAPFFPSVLTQSLASGLQTLDFSGVYILEGLGLQFPSVKFPPMPCLRKLTVEQVGSKWVQNLKSILEKAPSVRDLRMKNSWVYNRSLPFLEVKYIMRFLKCGKTCESHGYQSLNRLELGDSLDDKDAATLQQINQMFPNLKQLQFTCDDKARRLPPQTEKVCCDMNVMSLKGIVEGLKGWQSLEQLSVTYWPHLTITELLDHFQECATELPSLRLYDFKRINDDNNPSFHSTETSSGDYLVQLKEKMLKLKASPRLVFVLHNFQCLPEHRMNGKIERLRECSTVEEIFRLAEYEGVFNFRQGTAEKFPIRF